MRICACRIVSGGTFALKNGTCAEDEGGSVGVDEEGGSAQVSTEGCPALLNISLSCSFNAAHSIYGAPRTGPHFCVHHNYWGGLAGVCDGIPRGTLGGFLRCLPPIFFDFLTFQHAPYAIWLTVLCSFLVSFHFSFIL